MPPIPDELFRKLELDRFKEQARVERYGRVREPVHLPEFSGHRFVAVRNRLYYSKNWKFFSDFLFEYGIKRFGKEWVEKQQKLLPEERHPLYIM